MGYLNRNCELQFTHSYPKSFEFQEGLAVAQKALLDYDYLDVDGNIVLRGNDAADSGSSHRLICWQDDVDQLHGFKNHQGDWIIDPKFEIAGGFSEGLAEIKVKMRRTHLTGYINPEGTEVIPPKYLTAAGKFCEGMAQIVEQKSKRSPFRVGFIDRSGNPVIPWRFDLATDFSEGLAFVTAGRERGFIDRRGEWLLKGVESATMPAPSATDSHRPPAPEPGI